MSAASLRNMSVPPKSLIQVERPGLGGRAFSGAVTRSGRNSVLEGRTPEEVGNLLQEALESIGIPDRVGIFVADDSRCGSGPVPMLACLAVLARRSGLLYLPWRPLCLVGVEPAKFLLVFPEEGEEP